MDEAGCYFNAIGARALCEAGKFQLCGLALKPFSFRHCLQLDALGLRPWAGDGVTDASDFFLTAAVCSSSDFLTEFPQVREEDLVRFDVEDAWAVWSEYLRVCYFSRPELFTSEGGGAASHCRAPLAEYVTTYILRHAHGFTREWCMTAPVGEVLWVFEAIAEQIGTRSRILTTEEKERQAAEDTPAAQRARELREKTAGEIIRKVKDPKRQLGLLMDLHAGRLSKDWKSEVGGRKSGKARKASRTRTRTKDEDDRGGRKRG